MSAISLINHNQTIIQCKKCPRLAAYIREVADKKVRRFQNCDYWGKPVPGFGDPNARLLIIGLAPAAHGANRTGRMFTGDDVGRNTHSDPVRGLSNPNKNWLFKALHETGFANRSESISVNDGLKLKGVFITAVTRCAPPQNKPLLTEIENCSVYLLNELELLKNINTILCLGHIAFRQYCKLQNLKGLKFIHGAKYVVNNTKSKVKSIDSNSTLIVSYHPSRQNTNTGRLTWAMWIKIFEDIERILKV